MGHRIELHNFTVMRNLLTEQEARDIIDVLYRWNDSKFTILALPVANDAPKIRGDYGFMRNSSVHHIRLARNNIERAFREQQRCGGNTAPPSRRMAAAMVLAHEIQHANQQMGPAILAKHREYLRRGNERDARAFVDDNLRVIASVMGERVPSDEFRRTRAPGHGDHGEEILNIAELFDELSEVSVKDIVEELRTSGMNNAKNVGRIVRILTGQGIQVKVA